jgi:hypothetical protein
MLHQVVYEDRLDSVWQNWNMVLQTSYHKQYEISTLQTGNCGNKLKAGTDILVMVCMENGAISIFRRYKSSGSSSDQVRLDTKKPLVQIKGNTPSIMYYGAPMTGL